jgi:hypothetical protein
MPITHQIKGWTVGILAGVLGSAAQCDTPAGPMEAAAWTERLFFKAAEGFVDALSRAWVAHSAAPAAREEYQVGASLAYYDDQIWGTHRGVPMPQRFRRTWVDPVSGAPNYETYENGRLQDRESFFYIPHARDYECAIVSAGVTVTTYSIRASVQYSIYHKVLRSNLAGAVMHHRVQYRFVGEPLAPSCHEAPSDAPVWDIHEYTLPRGGSILRSPSAKNFDVVQPLVVYVQP